MSVGYWWNAVGRRRLVLGYSERNLCRYPISAVYSTWVLLGSNTGPSGQTSATDRLDHGKLPFGREFGSRS